MGATNLVIPEKDSAEGYEQEIDIVNDGLAAGGFYPQNGKPGDLSVGVERDGSGNLVLKDPVLGTRTLAQIASGPVQQYDFLLDNDPDSVGVTYAITRSSGLVTQESWSDTATTKTLKTISYTRSGGLLATEVVKVYGIDGTTVVAQKTVTYSRAGGVITGSTVTRDV